MTTEPGLDIAWFGRPGAPRFFFKTYDYQDGFFTGMNLPFNLHWMYSMHFSRCNSGFLHFWFYREPDGWLWQFMFPFGLLEIERWKK